jgi:hypothetical protein
MVVTSTSPHEVDDQQRCTDTKKCSVLKPWQPLGHVISVATKDLRRYTVSTTFSIAHVL